MSELIVMAFRDQYRAPEVLNELRRRRDWDWVADLDDAVAVMLDSKGGAKVQLNVDLKTCRGTAWARLWGSLLEVTLFIPTTQVIGAAADGIAITSGALTHAAPSPPAASPDARWWKERLRLSEDFIRDVGAMIGSGDSAVFMLSRAPDRSAVFRQLRNYGATLLHISLDSEQDEEMRSVLALS